MSNPEFPSNPWGDPEVVWLNPSPGNSELRYEAFKRLVSDPDRTHITREVLVRNHVLPHLAPSTSSEAEDTLSLVEDEFNKLEGFGVKIARPSWHIIPYSELTEFTPLSQDFLHILARVPVVDGEHPIDQLDKSHIPLDEACGLIQSVDRYLDQVRLNSPYLWDVKRLAQYIFGSMRIDEPGASKRPLMIDPDILIKINYE